MIKCTQIASESCSPELFLNGSKHLWDFLRLHSFAYLIWKLFRSLHKSYLFCIINFKGIVQTKMEFLLFQSCMSFLLMLKTKENIFSPH